MNVLHNEKVLIVDQSPSRFIMYKVHCFLWTILLVFEIQYFIIDMYRETPI